MTESRFKCQVVKLLRAELPGAWIYHPSDRWNSGIPDLLVLWCGRFMAIELKVGRNTATRLQLVTLQRIGAAGGLTAVCRTMEEVRQIVNRLRAEVVYNKEAK
jgi:hypothetical protein